MQKIVRAISSLVIIGLGQILKGNSRRGLFLMILGYGVIPWIFFFSLSISDTLTRLFVFFLLPTYLGLTLYSMVDAWR